MAEKEQAAAAPTIAKTEKTDPINVACPYCSSPSGDPCLRMTSGHQMAKFHLPRIKEALTKAKGIAAA